jgi:hypothetical protein
MKALAMSCAGSVLALFVAHSLCAEPRLGTPTDAVAQDAKKGDPKDKDKKIPEKDKKPPEKKEPPKSDLFTSTLPQDIAMPTYFNPQMMGNWHTVYTRQIIYVIGLQTTTTTKTTTFNFSTFLTTNTTTSTSTTPVVVARQVLVPASTRGAFNIADNESPMPVDRVFGFYNFYGGLGFPGGPNGPLAVPSTSTSVTNVSGGGVTTTTTSVNATTTAVPGVPRTDLHREVVGFEKTFLGGNASIELRVPILQQQDASLGFGGDIVGDLTIVTKYAFYLNRATGDVFSGGLVITAPTGRAITTVDGNIRDVLLEPWFGYIWNAERFYIQGFHSVVIPTDGRDVTLAFNDVGLYFWLWRSPNRFLSFVVPCVEGHVTTPLNHRDLSGDIVVPDTVAITTGIHFGLGRNSTLSLGVANPVTGPRPYNIEAFAQFNWRF